MWAIKNPQGKLMTKTIGDTKEDAEWMLFDHMPENFRLRYWKKPSGKGGSRAAARRLGYKAVRVKLVEKGE
jgi:hypothetical protein